MTNYPPEGNAPADPPQEPGSGSHMPQHPGSEPVPDPGYGAGQGPASGPAPDPGYGLPQDPGYGAAQGPGYAPPQGYEQAQYYEAPPGPGYALAQPENYAMPTGQDYPVQVTIEYPERSSRWLAGLSIPYFLIRLILLIPALFVIYFVGIAAAVVVWLSFWAVLFTGRYPRGFHEFATGYLRWSTRISAYLFGLTDKYPPFRLSP